MVSRAVQKYIRISPQKAREIIVLIKGREAGKALNILSLVNKKASLYFYKTVKSAISNAANKGIDTSNLYISKLIVNPGPVLKRYRAASFGRAVTIRRRTSHIEVELDLRPE